MVDQVNVANAADTAHTILLVARAEEFYELVEPVPFAFGKPYAVGSVGLAALSAALASKVAELNKASTEDSQHSSSARFGSDALTMSSCCHAYLRLEAEIAGAPSTAP